MLGLITKAKLRPIGQQCCIVAFDGTFDQVAEPGAGS